MRQLVGQKGHDEANRKVSKGQAERSSRERKQNSLGENLAENTSRRCAQRGSNRDLFLATEGLRQRQIGDVDASDQKDESYSSQQNQQRGTHIGDQILLHGDDHGAPSFVIVGILLLQPVGNRIHLGLRPV